MAYSAILEEIFRQISSPYLTSNLLLVPWTLDSKAESHVESMIKKSDEEDNMLFLSFPWFFSFFPFYFLRCRTLSWALSPFLDFFVCFFPFSLRRRFSIFSLWENFETLFLLSVQKQQLEVFCKIKVFRALISYRPPQATSKTLHSIYNCNKTSQYLWCDLKKYIYI